MSNTASQRFVLAADVEVFPASEASAPGTISDAVQASDRIVTNHSSRVRSRLVSYAVAEVLQSFAVPNTIVAVIKEFAAANGLQAKETLRDIFPALQEFVRLGWLVPAETATSKPSSRFKLGEIVNGWALLRNVQRLPDTELWLGKKGNRFAALKLVAEGAGSSVSTRLVRERDILQRLDPQWTPRVIEYGEAPVTYLATDWKFGVPLDRRPEHCRDNRITTVANLCRAYDSLHANGVLHVDVHPRNVLLDPIGNLAIIDFDRSALITERSAVPYRGGVAFFMPPEVAENSRRTDKAEVYTTSSEIFSVCALIYYLLAGRHYQDFLLEREQMLAQICSPLYVPLKERLLPQLSPICKVLEVGLAADPSQRWASMSELAQNVAIAAETLRSDEAPTKQRGTADQIRGRLLDIHHPNESSQIPSASVAYGAAGIAYFFWRKAVLLNDSNALAEADFWAEKSLSRATDESAFRSKDLGLDDRSAGPTSMMFGESGMWYVRAVVSQCLGDLVTREKAVGEFLEKDGIGEVVDVFSGRAGHLIGLCNLTQIGAINRRNAEKLIEDGLAWASSELRNQLEPSPHGNLGFAHGLTGIAYCASQCARQLNVELPNEVSLAIRMLVESGEPFDGGIRWPTDASLDRRGGRTFAEGWCRGTAGVVVLIASLLSNDSKLVDRDLLERAAAFLIENRGAIHDLCCGDIGQAFALIELLRVNPSTNLLRDIEQFVDSTLVAPESINFGASLLKGPLAARLLRLEIECTPDAVFPVFGAL